MTRFMDEAQTRRHGRQQGYAGGPGADAGFYELALRVVGAYIDQQQPETCSSSNRIISS